MRTSALSLVLAFLVVGCSKDDVSKNDQPKPNRRRAGG